MLVILHIPEHLRSIPPSHLASVDRFAAKFGSRHDIPPEQALGEIMPSQDDFAAFRRAAIIHVTNILVSDVAGFERFTDKIPEFHDSTARAAYHGAPLPHNIRS